MPRSRKHNNNVYFTKKTENAIIKYKKTKDDKLYTKTIHPALERMVEAIIKTYKFSDRKFTYKDMYSEGISYLYPKLFEFDEKRGKAFSFLGTCLKRHFIDYRQKNNGKKFMYIDSVGCRKTELDYMESIVPSTGEDEIDKIDNLEENKFFDDFLIHIEKIKNNICENIGEEIVFEAAVAILKDWHKIGLYNKKAFYICLRDSNNESSKTNTTVFNKIKEEMYIFKENYYSMEK